MTNMPPLVNNLHAPDVFADEATGFAFANGNVHITFSSYRVDHSSDPGPTHRVVIGRLVMPLEAAEAFQYGLADFISRMKSQKDSIKQTMQ
ncbi:MAG: hypothetical protein WDO70_05190 [Alphaproteobacteria bacterium]